MLLGIGLRLHKLWQCRLSHGLFKLRQFAYKGPEEHEGEQNPQKHKPIISRRTETQRCQNNEDVVPT
jgi:hypothetical protein